MKKLNFEKILIAGTIVITCFISYRLYKRGEISLFNKPKEESAVSVEIPFLEKEYKVSWKEPLKAKIINLAKFEEEESWQGGGDFDYNDFIEGKSSFCLNSQGQVSTASYFLKETINLDEFEDLFLFLNVKTPADNIEELNLIFENEKKETTKIPIKKLTDGWNLWTYTVKQIIFSNTEEKTVDNLILVLKSKPNSISVVNFDLLLGAKGKIQVDELISDKPEPIIFSNVGNNQLPLIVSRFSRNVAVKEITSVKNFVFEAKIRPLRKGQFGLFVRGNYLTGRGYYLVLDGIGKGSWKFLVEREKVIELDKDEFNNFVIEENKDIWLKVKANNSKISFYFSNDGKNFVKIGQINDETFSSGGVGFCGFEGVVYTVDEIRLTQ